jgi:hypothetical protein
MATYDQILTVKLPGQSWTMTGDTYGSLVWTGPAPKPSKATLDGWSAEVDTALQLEAAAATQAERFAGDNPDALFRAIEILIEFAGELYRVLPAAQKTAFADPILTRGIAMRDRIRDIRAGG